MKTTGQIERARRRLWIVTFAILASCGAVLIYVSSATPAEVPDPTFLPSRRILAFGLGGLLATFALYVLGSERKLQGLLDGLIAERLESERLALQHEEQRDFVSMAAHELRAPLTAIKGFTRTLMTKFDQLDEERRTRYLTLVNDQSNRLARLVDDLMQVSRIDAGRIRLEPRALDIHAVARAVVEQFRAKWTGHPIEIDAHAGLGAALADPHRVDEILINLIDNAVKYSPDGAPVVVSLRSDEGMVRIDVRDHGSGMHEDEVAGLFQKFHRLPAAAKSDVPGTGLGLYIVRGLALAHGGDITVTSTPGEGSTFTVTLPAAEAVAIERDDQVVPAAG